MSYEVRDKILLLEDDAAFATHCKTVLEKQNYDVDIVSDGSEGFYSFHLKGCDLLILDVMLPGMNGLEILKKVRAQKRFADFPIIVLANSYLQSIYLEAKRAHANFILPKRLASMGELQAAVNSILRAPISAMELAFDTTPEENQNKPSPPSLPRTLFEKLSASDEEDPFLWEVGLPAKEDSASKAIWAGIRRQRKTGCWQTCRRRAPCLTPYWRILESCAAFPWP